MAVRGLNLLSSRAIIGRYYATLEGAKLASWVDKLSMPMESNQDSETYAWLGMTPAMREWVGQRQAKGVKASTYAIANKHYELTLDVKTEDIRRDKTGQIMVRVDEAAGRNIQHWNSLLSTLLLNGHTTDCYDGQYFFDDDHSEGSSGTQKNYIASGDVAALGVTTASSPTAAEAAAALLGVISYMMAYKDDQGQPMNAEATSWLVMTPANDIWTAMLAATKNALISQSTNTLVSAGFNIEVVCNPLLTWTEEFAVFRTDARCKPLIRQTETEGTLKAIAEGSELEFNEGIWRFGLDAWRNVGYGYWQYASQCVLS